MRREEVMFKLITEIAEKDERIRAVYMNGSRTNPNVPKDMFQDYDIVYVVTETSSFINDDKWIRKFGEVLMMQEPDKLDKRIGLKNIDYNSSYTYLMLFKDGNRIDLRIQTKEEMVKVYRNDKLTVPLLDKDQILPRTAAATDIDYHVLPPTAPMFENCTNNFWWCLQNVAKGIWRDELPYAKNMFESIIRASLDKIVSWWIGIKHDFNISTGKMGKYYKKFLPISYWEMYKGTYSDSNYDHFWDSIFVTCDLFRILSKEVAEYFSFIYPDEDDINMTNYLIHVKNLPIEAKKIF